MAKNKKSREKKPSHSQMLAEKAKKEREQEWLRKEEERRLEQQRSYQERVSQVKQDGQLRTSLAKLAGIKSTFCLDEDTLLVTSFGRGNDAVLEHRIEREHILKICENPTLHIDPAEKKQFPVSGRTVNGIYPVGYIQDIRDHMRETRLPYAIEQKNRKKEWVEKHFFGQNYSDNIHVQLGYCILDIKKSISFHINHIVYALNNLEAVGAEVGDLVGTMPATTKYAVFSNPEEKDQQKKDKKDHFLKFSKNPRLGYFGDIFTPTKGDDRDYHIYQVLAMLSLVRNFCAHHQARGYDSLYNLTTQGNAQARQELLDRVYRDKINSLHKGFAEHSYVNLAILKQLSAFKGLSWEELAQAYYHYVMGKEYKNLGFSIKKLREKLVILNPEWKDQKFDSVRGKFYQLMDFVLAFYYMSQDGKSQCQDIVDGLRRCLTEQEKDALYERTARQLWEVRGDSLRELANKMDGASIQREGKKYRKSKDQELLPEQESMKTGIQRVQMDAEFCVKEDPNADQFCKAIYFLTHFLDGKEINDLLTTLIHQFENIASFMEVLEQSGVSSDRENLFRENYQIFRRSKDIATALRHINGFARMSKETAAAKMYMYVDASRILGVEGSEETLVDEWKQRFETARAERNTRRHPNGFRNFIANNVVASARFRYLVRYTDPATVCKLVENEAVVRFVLGRIPDEQIQRYHCACGLTENASMEIKRKELLERIQGFSLNELRDTVNDPDFDADANAAHGRKKQELVTLTSLYLTVLYLVSKNLVLVNARYFMAFNLLELDMEIYQDWLKEHLEQSRGQLALEYRLLEQKQRRKGKKTVEEFDFDKRALTAVWTAQGLLHEAQWYEQSGKRPSEECRHKKRLYPLNYLHQNLRSDQVGRNKFNDFRNKVEHLNFVRDACNILEKRPEKSISSYFQLYHYIVQKSLQLESSYLERGDYSKDALKVLCVPFGYSLPRYKNLTIEDLFDKNDTPEGSPVKAT